MSETTTEETPEKPEIETEQPIEPTEPESDALGDAGKKALDAMKAERNAAKTLARETQAELDRFKAEAALKDRPAEEQALEQARTEAKQEATKAANVRILRSELKAAAKGKLADPTDAALYINLDDFDVSDDGEVDSASLEEAIDDLLTHKPHLAAASQRRFEGDGDQGARGKSAKVQQLTRSDLQNMTPEEIEIARVEGRLNKALGIPT